MSSLLKCIFTDSCSRQLTGNCRAISGFCVHFVIDCLFMLALFRLQMISETSFLSHATRLRVGQACSDFWCCWLGTFQEDLYPQDEDTGVHKDAGRQAW